MDIILLVVRAGVTLLLYAYLFRYKGGTVGGTTFPPVAWSMFLYFVVMIFSSRDIARVIMEDVRSGAVEMLLVRPVHYLRYRMLWQIGDGLPSFVIASLVGGSILWAAVGLPANMHWVGFVPTFVITLIGTNVATILLYTLIGLCAFWIEDINPIYWIADKFVMVLGGAYFPVALFPPLMTQLTVWSPFGAATLLTRTTTDAWLTDWPLFMALQWGWIVLLGVATALTAHNARRHLSVNGG